MKQAQSPFIRSVTGRTYIDEPRDINFEVQRWLALVLEDDFIWSLVSMSLPRSAVE
jgi:hypothetical protein